VQNPTHTFILPGVYTVTLTVGNDLGSDTLVMEDMITVTEFETQTIYLPLVVS
jgi:PKD repeat protein